jgi:hypothetical protein
MLARGEASEVESDLPWTFGEDASTGEGNVQEALSFVGLET